MGLVLAAYAAAPSPALAANECGPPPPGGGTVTCSPNGNPYPNGIEYNVVEDLTVVLQPGVVTQQSVDIEATGAGMGPAPGRADQHPPAVVAEWLDAGEGVNVKARNGTVFVAVDDVQTTGANLSR
ncbi:MAG TPA: hypothetical protein VN240_07895, partial [Propylenella sp.]|nr:hypothetical protein [Propylenella sp.]